MENNKQQQSFVGTISDLYQKILKLPDLRPSKEVCDLLEQLRLACVCPIFIDVSKLTPKEKCKRYNVISLCSEAESLLESHYSDILASYDIPLDHLSIYPTYSNYILLCQFEFKILSNHINKPPESVAFIGSGPLPVSSILLATQHLNTARFHNYDIDPAANARASKLLRGHEDLEERMEFHTADVMDLTIKLGDYDVVFLASLVGIHKEDKVKVIKHLGKYMAPGAILVTRSAHGAHAFRYPVVEDDDFVGFEVLDVYHPGTDEFSHSVFVARKPSGGCVEYEVLLGGACKCREIMGA